MTTGRLAQIDDRAGGGACGADGSFVFPETDVEQITAVARSLRKRTTASRRWGTT